MRLSSPHSRKLEGLEAHLLLQWWWWSLNLILGALLRLLLMTPQLTGKTRQSYRAHFIRFTAVRMSTILTVLVVSQKGDIKE